MNSKTHGWQPSEKGSKIKRCTIPAPVVLTVATCCLISGASSAQQMGPSDEMIRGAYRDIQAQADTNRDGKLSMNECMAIWKDRKKGEKDCRYWDADGDGFILEGEYVRQVRKIMR